MKPITINRLASPVTLNFYSEERWPFIDAARYSDDAKRWYTTWLSGIMFDIVNEAQEWAE